MGRIIDFNPIRISRKTYTDVEVVIAMCNNYDAPVSFLYKEWRKYFMFYYKRDFFDIKNSIQDIIDDVFIIFCSKVRRRLIYVEDGILFGHDSPFKGTLISYLYSVAKQRNKENVRKGSRSVLLDDLYNISAKDSDDDDKVSVADTIADKSDNNPYLYTDVEQDMLDIISSSILEMSHKCKDILTKFYFENKSLDTILSEDAKYTSKNALKTEKNKCLNRLKTSARSSYYNYINS